MKTAIKMGLILMMGLLVFGSCRKYKQTDERLQTQINELNLRIIKIENDFRTLNLKADTLLQRINQTDSAVVELAGIVSELQQQISLISKQIDTIKLELNAVKVDVAKVLSQLSVLAGNVVVLNQNYLKIMIWISNHHGNNSNNSNGNGNGAANLELEPIVRF